MHIATKIRYVVLNVNKKVISNCIDKLTSNLKCERFISTSKKNSDTLVSENAAHKELETIETVVSKRKKNWQSYGFDFLNEADDLNKMHSAAFFGVSILMCGTCFIFAYYPDMNMYDWVRREGHIELHRRESLGLPLIDPNYVDPAKIELPSDDELGETEIII